MARGVRTIVESMGAEVIYDKNGPLRALVTHSPAPKPAGWKWAQKRRYKTAWPGPLDTLAQRISHEGSDASPVCSKALEGMVPGFEAVSCKTAHVDETRELGQELRVFAWLYCLEDDFVACLAKRQGQALVVFGFFALLLQELECFWFVEGWAGHILEAVRRGLDADGDKEHVAWLEWPLGEAGLEGE